MNTRVLLIRVTSVVAIVGAAFVSVPFVYSLGPSARAGETLPRVDIASLTPGSYLYSFPYEQHQVRWGYLMLRDFDGTLRVYEMKERENQILEPEMMWYEYGHTCTNFSPAPPAGKLAPGGRIGCLDNDSRSWGGSKLQWTLDGKRTVPDSFDLEIPKYMARGGDVVLGRSE